MFSPKLCSNFRLHAERPKTPLRLRTQHTQILRLPIQYIVGYLQFLFGNRAPEYI